ncbi:MAG: hypothetical protein ACRD1S_09025 [Vicinamibacterales bacterium]
MPKGTALATAIALVVALNVARGEIIDRVLAVVNGVMLTQTDVYGAMAFGLVDLGGGQGSEAPDPIQPALDRLIERELVLAEVNRYAPPEPPEAEITARAAAVRARFPSPEAYQRALASTGYTDERVRAVARDAIRIDTYLAQRFGGSVQPADRQILIADWKAGLRRRADVTIQYQPRARM